MGNALNTTPADWGDNGSSTENIVTESVAAKPESDGTIKNKSEVGGSFPDDIIMASAAVQGKSAISTENGERRITFGEYSMSIDEVYRDIKRLTLSKNPLDLIFKANEIREKFAFFINSLAAFISKSFSFEDESFSYELYHDSEYHRVWMELCYTLLRDARFISGDFDVIGYTTKDDTGADIHQVVNLDEILIRSRKSQLDDEDFAAVRALVQTIIETYRRDETVSHRYATCEIPTIAATIGSFVTRQVEDMSDRRENEVLRRLDLLVANFPHRKLSFRADVQQVFEELNVPHYDVDELRTYIFRKMVESHYPEVRHVFFDTNLPYGKNRRILRKEEWLRLKGAQELSINNIGVGKGEAIYRDKNREYFVHVLNCKNLILDLEGSILSPILLPIILKLIASSLTLAPKDFSKFSYILLFLFANSYENEYIPLSRFLSELEVYINYANARRGFERFKIGFSLIVLFALFVVLGYFLLPPLVFIGGVVLVSIYLKMYFIDDYTLSASIQLNTGIRLWAIVILAIFGYTWLTNIGSYTNYYSDLQKRVAGFGTRIVAEILPPEQIAEGVKHGAASVLEWQWQSH